MKLRLLLNRHDRTWDRSGRVTAVLPHDSYHVSLDRSRRVTQRTRAYIKPISLFPIRAGDAFCAPQPLGVTSDAPRAGLPLNVAIPVPAPAHTVEAKASLEPAFQTKDANEDVLEGVKCPVDRPALTARSASPVVRHR